MKRAGEVLSALFDEKFMKKAGEYSALFSCWKDLMEKNGIAAAADHSRVKSLDRGLVWVEVDHPGWKQIIQTKESKLLSDFRRRFPDTGISGLSILLCKPGEMGTENEGKKQAEEKQCETADTRARIPDPPPSPNSLSGYNSIKDGGLKETLMRLEQNITERDAETVINAPGHLNILPK